MLEANQTEKEEGDMRGMLANIGFTNLPFWMQETEGTEAPLKRSIVEDSGEIEVFKEDGDILGKEFTSYISSWLKNKGGKSMTIGEEIDEVAGNTVEAPDRKKMEHKKFSSGQNGWLGTDFQERCAGLERCAIAGCIGAKYTLMAEPFNVKALVRDGRKII